MKIITNLDIINNAHLSKWAGAETAEVFKVLTLNVAPKKFEAGKLVEISKTSTINVSAIRLYGVNATHYVFRVDLTSLLGFSYKEENKMRTGVSFKLSKECFDYEFHAQVNAFMSNFSKFVEWRASQWDNLLPYTSKWSQENQKTPPGVYFNKDTAFNGTLCSWNKLEAIPGLNTKGIDKSFVNSCIVPSIQLGKFALAYSEKETKIGSLSVVQKVVEAFDYQGLEIESFSGGGTDVTSKKGTVDLFALMSDEPEGGTFAPTAPTSTIVEIGGKSYVLKDGAYLPVGV